MRLVCCVRELAARTSAASRAPSNVGALTTSSPASLLLARAQELFSWCEQAALEEALGFPSPGDLLREVLALAHFPAGPEAEGAPDAIASNGEGYSYGRGMAALAGDDEFDEEEEQGGDAAVEPAAAAGPQLAGST